MSEYNYRSFPRDLDMATFEAFPDLLRVGERAPNAEVVNAATGEPAKLSRYWRNGAAVIEFGSIT